MQNEFSLDENIALARQFLCEQFVSRGMIVDYSLHEPDKEDGGIKNPHFHVLCPIRPLDRNGKWGAKQRRVYELDEGGNRIRDESGGYVFKAVSTTDWGSPETLEEWRRAWADMCNAKFAEKDLSCHVDNRSYERQGVEQIPTKHEGPTVRAMEAKGIKTDKGDLNRWIRATNDLMREIKRKIDSLISFLTAIKKELAKTREPTLIELLNLQLQKRNSGAWSSKAKANNLKLHSVVVLLLQEKKLVTLDDLIGYMQAQNKKIDAIKASSKKKSERIKELNDLLRIAEFYAEGRPVYDELNKFAFKKKREQFRYENGNVLDRFFMAQRKLKRYLTPDGKLPVSSWRRELASLKGDYEAGQAELKPMYVELKQLWKIRIPAEDAAKAIGHGENVIEKARDAEPAR